MSKVGIMNPAYFVGRKELVGWMSEFLQLHVQGVEDAANGAIPCHILDAVHPGVVAMSKVDFAAKTEYDMIRNWKVFQNAADKISLPRKIEVERLIKGRTQDNLEFMQWLYCYFQEKYGGQEYDAVARRVKSKGARSPGSGVAAPNIAGRARPPPRGARHNGSTQRVARTAASSSRNTAPKPNTTRSQTKRPTRSTIGSNPAANSQIRKELSEMKARVVELEDTVRQRDTEYAELTKTAKELEKERDFYFQKVLEVEEICKSQADIPVIQRVLDVLYRTDDEDAGEVQGVEDVVQDSDIVHAHDLPIEETGAEVGGGVHSGQLTEELLEGDLLAED